MRRVTDNTAGEHAVAKWIGPYDFAALEFELSRERSHPFMERRRRHVSESSIQRAVKDAITASRIPKNDNRARLCRGGPPWPPLV